MPSSVLVVSAAYILLHYLIEDYKHPRRWWQGDFYKRKANSNLLLDLKSQEISGHFKNFTRISPTDFEYLLNLVGPKIKTRDTKFRKAISVQHKLALTLRFLATGDSLQYLFRISKQVISKFVPQVCLAIISELKHHIEVLFI